MSPGSPGGRRRLRFPAPEHDRRTVEDQPRGRLTGGEDPTLPHPFSRLAERPRQFLPLSGAQPEVEVELGDHRVHARLPIDARPPRRPSIGRAPSTRPPSGRAPATSSRRTPTARCRAASPTRSRSPQDHRRVRVGEPPSSGRAPEAGASARFSTRACTDGGETPAVMPGRVGRRTVPGVTRNGDGGLWRHDHSGTTLAWIRCGPPFHDLRRPGRAVPLTGAGTHPGTRSSCPTCACRGLPG